MAYNNRTGAVYRRKQQNQVSIFAKQKRAVDKILEKRVGWRCYLSIWASNARNGLWGKRRAQETSEKGLHSIEGLIAESDYTFKHEGSPITINTWTSDNKNYIITWTGYANDGSATGTVSEERKVNFLVASDNAVEVHTAENDGEKVYDHELYLIELTKTTEGFIGDSIAFTNVLGNDYTTQDDWHFRLLR